MLTYAIAIDLYLLVSKYIRCDPFHCLFNVKQQRAVYKIQFYKILSSGSRAVVAADPDPKSI